MRQKKHLDEVTGLYVPSFAELGITEKDSLSLSPEQYDQLIYDWRILDRKRQAQKAARKTANAEKKNSRHWYNTMSNPDRAVRIEGTRILADEVIDDLIGRTTLQSMRDYYESLRVRVKHSPITLHPVSTEKLAKFPKDNGESLHGSMYSFARLWSHVFPPDHKHSHQRGRTYSA